MGDHIFQLMMMAMMLMAIMMMVIFHRVTVGVRSQWQTLGLELTLLLEPSALALDALGCVLHSLHILWHWMRSFIILLSSQ